MPVLWEHTATGVAIFLVMQGTSKQMNLVFFLSLHLERSNKYVEMVKKLVERGRLGLALVLCLRQFSVMAL